MTGDEQRDPRDDVQRLYEQSGRRVRRANARLDTVVWVEDVPASRVQHYRDVADIYEDLFRTYVEANQDYGNSFVTAGKDVASHEGGPFSDPTRASLFQLFTRTADKRNRFHTLVFDGQDPNRESALDTALDNANYWIQMAWLLQSAD